MNMEINGLTRTPAGISKGTTRQANPPAKEDFLNQVRAGFSNAMLEEAQASRRPIQPFQERGMGAGDEEASLSLSQFNHKESEEDFWTQRKEQDMLHMELIKKRWIKEQIVEAKALQSAMITGDGKKAEYLQGVPAAELLAIVE